MKYIIGVDGGGTKTEAIAYDSNGMVLKTGYSGHGNLLVDKEKGIYHIIDAIKQCLVPLGAEKCVYLYLGLAGIDSGMYQEELEKEIQQFGIPYLIMNDVKLAHAALLKGKDGILTISGTGSVSYGVKGNDSEMSGGWGHLLGDEGSGYWIVVESLKKMIKDHDHMKQLSNLSLKILETLEIDSVPNIKTFVYSSEKGKIAALVPVIVKEAESGNGEARRILKEAGIHLAIMTLHLFHKLHFESEVWIGVKGSVLTQIADVRDAFAETIHSEIENVKIIDDQTSATKGAYYLALKDKKIKKN